MLVGRVSLEPPTRRDAFTFLPPPPSFHSSLDHRIIVDRLRHWVGLSGSALSWFISYLSNRTFCCLFWAPFILYLFVAVGPVASSFHSYTDGTFDSSLDVSVRIKKLVQ